MKVMYWLFGLLAIMAYVWFVMADVAPLPTWLFFFAIVYGFGGFFGLITYGARK